MLLGDLSVVKEPDIVFQYVVITSGGVRVSNFGDEADVVIHDVVVVDEKGSFWVDVDVHSLGIEPVAFGYGGVVVFLGDDGVFL